MEIHLSKDFPNGLNQTHQIWQLSPSGILFPKSAPLGSERQRNSSVSFVSPFPTQTTDLTSKFYSLPIFSQKTPALRIWNLCLQGFLFPTCRMVALLFRHSRRPPSLASASAPGTFRGRGEVCRHRRPRRSSGRPVVHPVRVQLLPKKNERPTENDGKRVKTWSF